MVHIKKLLWSQDVEADELIWALKEIIHMYDVGKQIDKENNKEIHMWRERFLKSEPPESDVIKVKRKYNAFMYTPSHYMVEKGVEGILEDLKNWKD